MLLPLETWEPEPPRHMEFKYLVPYSQCGLYNVISYDETYWSHKITIKFKKQPHPQWEHCLGLNVDIESDTVIRMRGRIVLCEPSSDNYRVEIGRTRCIDWDTQHASSPDFICIQLKEWHYIQKWSEKDPRELLEVYLRVKVHLWRFEVEVPSYGLSETYDEKKMILTVGKTDDSKTYCVHIPERALRRLPIDLQRRLQIEKHANIDDLEEQHLYDLLVMDVAASRYWQEDLMPIPWPWKRLYLLGTLHARFSEGSFVPTLDSPLMNFYLNFHNMKNLQNGRSMCDMYAPKWNLEKKPMAGPGLDVLATGPEIQLFEFENTHTFKIIHGCWRLTFFKTDYGGEEYLGFTFASRKPNLIITHDYCLMFYGYEDVGEEQPKENLQRVFLARDNFEDHFTFSSPCLFKMSFLESIGMKHEMAKIMLLTDQRDVLPSKPDVINFLGDNNYTIISDDKTIHLRREILTENSEYFRQLFEGEWNEKGKNTIELKDDDPKMLIKLFELQYGEAFPMNYTLVADLMILAKKYWMVNITRFFDALLVSRFRDKQLPLIWWTHIDVIIRDFDLPGMAHAIYSTGVRELYVPNHKIKMDGQENVMIDFLRATSTVPPKEVFVPVVPKKAPPPYPVSANGLWPLGPDPAVAAKMPKVEEVKEQVQTWAQFKESTDDLW